MRLHQSTVEAVVVAIAALLTGGWMLQASSPGSDAASGVGQALFHQTRTLLEERYVDEKRRDELYRMATRGMIAQLDDPYTVLLDSLEYANLQVSTRGKYGGLGISIEQQQGWVTVVDVFPGTPAARAGLQPGDRIIAARGKSARDWTVSDAVRQLRGPRGSSVTVTVRRVGVDDPLSFEIERARIQIDSVRSFMLTPTIGYVRLQRFSQKAGTALRDAIDGLRSRGMRKLVLDLSGNPGGLLDQGVAVADLFLPEGEEVVSTRSRLPGQDETYEATSPSYYAGLPVAVVVNLYTASAAEIVTGALQDHDRALVVGTRTLGKGSVQNLFPLADDYHLKMTTARWYTPVGRSIQRHRGDRQGLFASLRSNAIAMNGAAIRYPEPDTARRATFQTDAGRTVYGGGGITPDSIVPPDTLSSDARMLRTLLLEAGLAPGNAAFRFAVRWNESHDVQRLPSVDREVIDAYYEYLRERTSAPLDRALYEDARPWIEAALTRQLARTAFGREARLRVRARRNRAVQTARRALGAASTTRALLGIGGSGQDTSTTAGTGEPTKDG